ncbi:hypothetical protein N8955_00055 [bacterium]|jgi:hypothetical protein|nr:hypothetical protein [Hellea sp.]MDA7807107.1 hypothetical protein [bacterium]MDA9047740.1 hypothetical protein [Hellea sp.]MDA9225374.1 hypothetical protein [bacterium]
MKDLKQKVQDVVDKTIHQKQQLKFQEKTVKDQSNAIEEQAKRIAKLSDESN